MKKASRAAKKASRARSVATSKARRKATGESQRSLPGGKSKAAPKKAASKTKAGATKPSPRANRTYEPGQRWAFDCALKVFEPHLTIGDSYECHTSRGVETHFTVSIPFTPVAQKRLPPNTETQLLAMSAKDLDRNVTHLIATGVELPFWWKAGKRYESPDDVPSYLGGVVCCTDLRETLPERFKTRTHIYNIERKRLAAVERTMDQLRRRPPKPSRSVTETWKRLGAFMQSAAQSLRLGKGASNAAIDRLERLIGSKLPKDFRESLRAHNGGGWWVLPNYGELLSIAEIERQWSMYKEWQESGEYANDSESSWQVRDCTGPIKPIFWNVKRIPITDNSGDHLMLDLDPPEDGVYGQVIDHSHEVGPERVAASSWGEFLANLLDDLERGRYVPDESGCLRRPEDL